MAVLTPSLSVDAFMVEKGARYGHLRQLSQMHSRDCLGIRLLYARSAHACNTFGRNTRQLSLSGDSVAPVGLRH